MVSGRDSQHRKREVQGATSTRAMEPRPRALATSRLGARLLRSRGVRAVGLLSRLWTLLSVAMGMA